MDLKGVIFITLVASFFFTLHMFSADWIGSFILFTGCAVLYSKITECQKKLDMFKPVTDEELSKTVGEIVSKKKVNYEIVNPTIH